LEYRGYDSAGIAIGRRDSGNEIAVRKTVGAPGGLRERIAQENLPGTLGIGHTRWATHGAPTETNAHPHTAAGIAVVHNGIIENDGELRRELIGAGYQLMSETDSEVVPNLIAFHQANGADLVDAVLTTAATIRGRSAFAVISEDDPDTIIAARCGSPLVVGRAEGGAWVSSDGAALCAEATEVAALEDGEVALLRRDGVTVLNRDGHPVTREWLPRSATTEVIDHEGYDSFMAKEIAEQAFTISQTAEATETALGVEAFEHLDRLVMIACGSSRYAAEIGKAWFERYARLPCDVEIASEYHHRAPIVGTNTMVMGISQSGETADTLAALDYVRGLGRETAALVNVPTSQMARSCDRVWLTQAGVEIGVAATKSFTSQLTALAVLAIRAAALRGTMDPIEAQAKIDGIKTFGVEVEALQVSDSALRLWSETMAGESNALFLGRGVSAAVAEEGALKLKEISYIHAEAYPSGELKHGPLALVDERMPVVALVENGPMLEKSLSSLQEVMARKGRVFVIGDARAIAAAEIKGIPGQVLMESDSIVTDISVTLQQTVAVQLLAYHTARVRGCDVDKPRNLAKSVTVE
ncbi:MAG: glutamine--fructose-6-phosphate transaminase (isomerizing), partial [Pseudomonadota bacterium]